MGVYCKIESSKIVDGRHLMEAVATLKQWDSPLDNLEYGYYMFAACTNLTDFRGNLKKLSEAPAMFAGCPLDLDSISYIAGSLPYVSSGTIDIGYLRVADGGTTEGLEFTYYPIGNDVQYVNSQLALMKEKGWTLYSNQSPGGSSYEVLGSSTRDKSEDLMPNSYEYIAHGAADWNRQPNRNIEVEKVLNGVVLEQESNGMYCYVATDKIVGGENLFYNFTSLKKFDSDLSRLMYGHNMFYLCHALDTFSADLSSLEFGYSMFPQTALTTWDIDMPNLVIGDGMFDLSNLNSFNGSLKNLKMSYGLGVASYYSGMFTNLKHFKTDSLGSLLSGTQMFDYQCRLDLESVNNIADVIQDIKNIDKNNDELWKCEWIQPTDGGRFFLNSYTINREDRGRIDIGVSDDVDYYDAGVKMIQKGWDVYFNGTKFGIESPYNVTSSEATIPNLDNWVNQNLYLKKVVDGVGFGDLPDIRIETNKVVDGDGFPSTTLQEWDSDLSSLVNGETMFGGAINLVSFKSDLSSLQTQYRMFAVTALTSWDNDLPKLVEGGGMFGGCQSLNSFRGDLSKLVDSYSGTNRLCGMFSQSSLVDFESSLKSLKSGYDMFDGCELSDKSIAIIAGGINDISGLDKNNNSDWTYQVFDGTTTQNKIIYQDWRGAISIGDRQLSSDAPLYRNSVAILQEKGWDVYIGGSLVEPQSRVGYTGYDCTAADASGWNSSNSELKSITTKMLGGIGVYFSGQYGSFYVDTQHIENGNRMFLDFTKLESWYGDLDSLVSSDNMFAGCNKLTSFRGNLSNLKNGTHMFTGCSSLNEFSVNNLNNLENGYQMFSASALTSWDIDLPRLTWAEGMFNGCQHLTSFEGDLSSLVTTVQASNEAMFGTIWGDNKLQFCHFKSKLTSLLCGYNMFRNCNLDKESIDYIAKYINDISGLDKNNNADWTYEFSEGTGQIEGSDRGRIDISVAEGVDYRNAVMIMKLKGWDVYLDGTLL